MILICDCKFCKEPVEIEVTITEVVLFSKNCNKSLSVQERTMKLVNEKLRKLGWKDNICPACVGRKI
jgi:hypothetical protein